MFRRQSDHKSTRIASVLLERFRRQNLSKGALLPSTHAIAEEFQVSLMTAHQSMQELEGQGVVYRIRGSGTYLKSEMRVRPRIGLADCNIELLYNKKMQQIQNQVIDFCIEYLTAHHYDIQTISYSELNNQATASRLLESLDGLLLSYNYADSGIVNKLRKANLPVVVYRHEFLAELPFSQVIFDFSQGIEDALGCLSLTLEDAPVVLYEATPSSLFRRDLLVASLQGAGISSDKVTFHEVTSVDRTANCFRLARVLGGRWRNRLLICVIDDIAAAIVSAFRVENMVPGRDYRLLSIGNSEEYGFQIFDAPCLACIDMPLKKLAIESCQLLKNLIEKPDTCQHIIRVPGRFIKRASLFLNPDLQPIWLDNELGMEKKCKQKSDTMTHKRIMTGENPLYTQEGCRIEHQTRRF